MAFDLHARFHETWLGMVQPVEGLVVSIPVLVESQTMERHHAELQERFHAVCPLVDADTGLALEGEDVETARSRRERDEVSRKKRTAHRRYRSLGALLEQVLGWTPELYDIGEEVLPRNLSRYISEGHQTIRPTLALHKLAGADEPARPVAAVASASTEAARADDEADDESSEADDDSDEVAAAPRPGKRALTGLPDIETPESLAGKPYVALVWELPPGLALDKPETATGDWRYPPAAKFDRLLRACRVPIGLLTNGDVVRLVYAPHGEATGSITFDLTAMGTVDGRPILDAFVMLLSAQRFFGVTPDDSLPGLLRRSRERQANVTNALAAQVFDALDHLLRGFEAASHRDRHADLRALLAAAQADDGRREDHLYGGLLTVLLRLVFLLYAEDRELLPTDHDTYRESLSVSQLFEDLQRDFGAFPDTMSRRFGAWARLAALFRTIHDGVEHGSLQIPRRRGELFDPSRFPFLESWAAAGTAVSADPAELAAVGVPTVDDETVYRVLERLMILEGQRLSYKVLDVEQIGSVYEALMGYRVVALASPGVCCRHKSLQGGSTGGVWIEAGVVLEEKPANRSKFLIETYDVTKADAKKIAGALKSAKDEDEVVEVLESIGLKKVARRSAGQLVLQPGEERRRTSSHYTPRSLSQPIVRRTLEPLLAAMSDTGEPSSRQLLSLKVCDPAMGSGAFLVEACRFLGDHVVAAWEREGQVDKIASAKEDVVNHARRLVAQTCLYGVDKNPFAVHLAKLSMWLVTLAKDEPFTFVDHALRHGDSLVGLSFEQIQAFHWAPSSQMDLIEKELASCVAESLILRQQILDLAAESSPGVTGLKEKLLWDANDAQDRARLIGDLVVGAFFEVPKKEREAERRRRLDLVRSWLAEGGVAPDELRELSDRVRQRLAAFHWELELPEVFHRHRRDPLMGSEFGQTALMDAFVGNPPFLGGRRTIGSLGEAYSDWLETLHGSSRNADLSAHFFRRADALLGTHGAIGFIATNTIAQGDTRNAGLRPLLAQGSVLYDATRSMLWPGDAAVAVAVVHLAKGRIEQRAIPRRLEALIVPVINSSLRAKPERPDPTPLASNAGFSYQGSILAGIRFTLAPEERDALVKKSAANAKRLFPFIGGKEVNSSPTQTFDRYVVNFGSMDLEEAGRWPDLLSIVREHVKPIRDKVRREAHRKYWWQFGDKRPALYAALTSKQRCVVAAIVSKHLMFSFQPTDRVYSHKLQVFPFDTYSHLGVLQSRIHEVWAWLLSSTLEDRLNYSASECFETFPFPPEASLSPHRPLEEGARILCETRAELMVDRNQGLTTTYNQLKDPDVTDPEIVALRELHLNIDRAVLAAYGWQDLEPPPFTEPITDVEWKAKEAFDDEVIDRLFALNAERAEEERLLGLATTEKAKPATKAPKTRKKTSPDQLKLAPKKDKKKTS